MSARRSALFAAFASAAICALAPPSHGSSVARLWNDANLDAIRNDFARPTIHARNLYHISVAMFDAWAAYDPAVDGVIHDEQAQANDIELARAEAVSFAAYRMIQMRYAKAPGAAVIMAEIDGLMDTLGYDKSFFGTAGHTPAAVGNRVAFSVIAAGLEDGSNEAGGYENRFYEPLNPPLLPDFPGNPDLKDPNRWQPLALDWFKDQGGFIIVGGYPEFLSPEWGQVTPFSLTAKDLTIHNRDGFDYWIYHDPGPPPHIGGEGDAYYKWGFEQVAVWSGHLDAADGVMWDVSPASIGNAPLADPGEYETFYDLLDGGDWGTGYALNPVTGEPYEPQIVPRGDYARCLAEFWADGPDSETPPGHWFTILNYVSDHPLHVNQLGGEGPILGDLEWEVKSYLAMAGAMHDVAVASWGVKGWYDFIRPVSAIRYMADQGQCTDPTAPSYDPNGINLIPDVIELVTEETTAPGGKHEHLIGNEGKIAIHAWRGHIYITDPETDTAGVGWILAENWWPYQRPSFVTPPFAGYVSGHSTYSRAAARVMEYLTGSPYFPGGLGEFHCPANQFLVFEDGPSVDVTLQWARYMDASDQCSLSRIWGGIHPGGDDLPGRHMGEAIAPESYWHAVRYFNGQISCPSDMTSDRAVDVADLLALLSNWGECSYCATDIDGDGMVGVTDLLGVLSGWGSCD